MTWVPTAGRRKPHQRTGQQSITQQAHSLPFDVLAAGQTPTPLPVSVARHATPGFHVQKWRRRTDVCSTAEGPPSPPHAQPEDQNFC